MDDALCCGLAASAADGDLAGVTVGEGNGGFVIAGAGTEVDGAGAFAAFDADGFDAADWPAAVHLLDEGGGDGGGEGVAVGVDAGGGAFDLEDVVLALLGGVEANEHGAGAAGVPSGGLAFGVGDGGVGGHGPVHLVAGIKTLVGDGAAALDLEAVDGEVLGGNGADGTGGEVVSGDGYDDLAGLGAAIEASATGAEVDGEGVGEGALRGGPGEGGAGGIGGLARIETESGLGIDVFYLFLGLGDGQRCGGFVGGGDVLFLAGREGEEEGKGEQCAVMRRFHTLCF